MFMYSLKREKEV